MCRSGDRTQLRELPPTGCRIVAQLRQEVSSAALREGEETLHERHRRIRESMPDVTPSLLSNLLLNIGQTTTPSQPPEPSLLVYHTEAVFYLRLTDVRAVCRAIET